MFYDCVYMWLVLNVIPTRTQSLHRVFVVLTTAIVSAWPIFWGDKLASACGQAFRHPPLVDGFFLDEKFRVRLAVTIANGPMAL